MIYPISEFLTQCRQYVLDHPEVTELPVPSRRLFLNDIARNFAQGKIHPDLAAQLVGLEFVELFLETP